MVLIDCVYREKIIDDVHFLMILSFFQLLLVMWWATQLHSQTVAGAAGWCGKTSECGKRLEAPLAHCRFKESSPTTFGYHVLNKLPTFVRVLLDELVFLWSAATPHIISHQGTGERDSRGQRDDRFRGSRCVQRTWRVLPKTDLVNRWWHSLLGIRIEDVHLCGCHASQRTLVFPITLTATKARS